MSTHAVTIPPNYICPISKSLMLCPVYCTAGDVTGVTGARYDRVHLRKWIAKRASDTLPSIEIVDDTALAAEIRQFIFRDDATTLHLLKSVFLPVALAPQPITTNPNEGPSSSTVLPFELGNAVVETINDMIKLYEGRVARAKEESEHTPPETVFNTVWEQSFVILEKEGRVYWLEQHEKEEDVAEHTDDPDDCFICTTPCNRLPEQISGTLRLWDMQTDCDTLRRLQSVDSSDEDEDDAPSSDEGTPDMRAQSEFDALFRKRQLIETTAYCSKRACVDHLRRLLVDYAVFVKETQPTTH